jgi:hypothetical protein
MYFSCAATAKENIKVRITRVDFMLAFLETEAKSLKEKRRKRVNRIFIFFVIDCITTISSRRSYGNLADTTTHELPRWGNKEICNMPIRVNVAEVWFSSFLPLEEKVANKSSIARDDDSSAAAWFIKTSENIVNIIAITTFLFMEYLYLLLSASYLNKHSHDFNINDFMLLESGTVLSLVSS